MVAAPRLSPDHRIINFHGARRMHGNANINIKVETIDVRRIVSDARNLTKLNRQLWILDANTYERLTQPTPAVDKWWWRHCDRILMPRANTLRKNSLLCTTNVQSLFTLVMLIRLVSLSAIHWMRASVDSAPARMIHGAEWKSGSTLLVASKWDSANTRSQSV